MGLYPQVKILVKTPNVYITHDLRLFQQHWIAHYMVFSKEAKNKAIQRPGVKKQGKCRQFQIKNFKRRNLLWTCPPPLLLYDNHCRRCIFSSSPPSLTLALYFLNYSKAHFRSVSLDIFSPHDLRCNMNYKLFLQSYLREVLGNIF